MDTPAEWTTTEWTWVSEGRSLQMLQKWKKVVQWMWGANKRVHNDDA